MCLHWPDVLYDGCSGTVCNLEFSGCVFSFRNIFLKAGFKRDISVSSSLKFCFDTMTVSIE